MRLSSILAVILLLFILIPYTMVLAETGAGYIAIRDYLGKIWTMDDVQKILNTRFKSVNGGMVSLGDYFVLKIDGGVLYYLKDFIVSPIDGETAVLPLGSGEHVIDIQWFGYHQRVLVNVRSGEVSIVDLGTAPVVPFKYSGGPSNNYVWDVVGNPQGLTIQRRDGKAYIRFNVNSTYITIAWFDEDTGWNMYPIDVYVNNKYQFKYFHITDPGRKTYSYTEQVYLGGLWLGVFGWYDIKYDLAKIYEEINWSRRGEILFFEYKVGLAVNTMGYDALQELCDSLNRLVFSSSIDLLVPGYWFIDHVKGAYELLDGSYKNVLAALYSDKYKKMTLLVYDVFVTPTQIIVFIRGYHIIDKDHVVQIPITSPNGFIYRNTVMFWLQLQGGAWYFYISNPEKYWLTTSSGNTVWIKDFHILTSGYVRGSDYSYPRLVGGDYYTLKVDDLSKYYYNVFIRFDIRGTYSVASYIDLFLSLVYVFDKQENAKVFDDRLSMNNIEHYRYYNKVVVLVNHTSVPIDNSYRTVSILIVPDDLEKIVNLIPPNSSGYIYYTWNAYHSGGGTIFNWASKIRYGGAGYVLIRNYKQYFLMFPRLIVPQISLMTDGFYHIVNAYAFQIYSTLVKEDSELYMLGYYILGNEPPPCYVIRDIHPDFDKLAVENVFTIISMDALGRDIVVTSKEYVDHKNIWYMRIKNNTRFFSNVTVALFSFSKMKFLNMAPELIEHLLAIPPGLIGYGTPVVDFSEINVIGIDMSSGKLYVMDNNEWREVRTVFDNSTYSYSIYVLDGGFIETIGNGSVSKYLYKYVGFKTVEGYLFNDNGVLKMVSGAKYYYTVTPDDIERIIDKLHLNNVFENFAKDFSSFLGNTGSGWFNVPWNLLWWILIGIGVLFVIILLVMALPKTVVVASAVKGLRR